jgi:hypothetical protein
MPIDVQWVIKQQQGILFGRRVLEIPRLAMEKTIVLGVDPCRGIEWNVRIVGRSLPFLDF